MDNNENEEKEKPAEAQTGEQKDRLTLYRKPKRNGKYLSKLEKKDLDALQKRKSLFMYLSTLFFAVSLLLPPEGREKLSNTATSGHNAIALSLTTLYLVGWVSLIVLSVYVSLMNRSAQKIGPELKESNVPRDGLDRHTFRSYEFFNVLHVLMAGAEIAVSVYAFDVWGALNIAASVASAVFSVLSRQILFKANAGNLEFIPGREE